MVYAKSAINIDYYKVMKDWITPVDFYCTGELQKVVMFCADNYFYLIMPMPINDNYFINQDEFMGMIS